MLARIGRPGQGPGGRPEAGARRGVTPMPGRGKTSFTFESQSPDQEIAAMVLAALSSLHATPALLAIAFAVLLVAVLVAAEEAERRAGGRPDERGA